MKKIYLAGPEVFFPDAKQILESHKSLCTKYGFTGLSPFDSVLSTAELEGMELAKGIFANNIKLINECDIIFANCNSFRGPLVDDGTAFEIGYGFAIGKKIYGYINKKSPLPELVQRKIKTYKHASGFLIDEDGYLLNENFGNSINLMLEFAIVKSNGVLVEGNFEEAIKFILTRE
jgi:nucleoside 2-deoxyribosyltransferase